MADDLLLIVGITFLCMISPGPDMALVMRNTLMFSRADGIATSLGILTGNFVHIGYCAFGIGYIVANSIVVYSVLRYAGAAYLIVLGVQSVRSANRSAAHEALPGSAAADGRVTKPHVPYIQGLANNLLNPKGALFYLGVFTQVIRPGTHLAEAAMLVTAMVMTSALFWLFFVVTLEQPWLRSALRRWRSNVERVFGFVLIALGLRVALDD